uniref:BTB domain-containing protein n=1 Tax=Strongyloides venezuelensis TaxID=75913 RepID=A0A0K0FW32_STRVS
MSSGNINIKDLINDCDTLSDITKLLSKTNSIDYEVHKKYDYLLSCFDIKLSNIDDIRNSDILCSNMYDHEKISINDMKTILSSQPKINFEINNFISFLVEDDTEKLSDDDKIYLASKYSSFFQFIIDKFPNVNELNISNHFDNVSNSCFILHIYGKLKSTEIKKAGSIYFDEILKYAGKYNFSNYGVFDGLPNLHEIYLYIRSNADYDNLSNIDDSIKNFLDYIAKIKDVRLIIGFECSNNDSLANALKMLNYGKTINLNIQMDHDLDWNKYLKENNYNLSEGRMDIKNVTKSLTVFINEINDFKVLKILLNSLENLEYIVIYIENSLPKVVLDEYKSLDDTKVYLKQLFNYRSCLKNLTNARISFGKYYTSPEDSNSENIKHLYNFMMECIISILPSSISKLLYLMEAENMTLEYFEKIGTLFPSLTTISFLLCYNIPENALYKIPSLKNVAFNGERKVNIPPWIETVVFLYFDSDFYYPDDVVSDNKNNEHYFNLMNNRFNVSLRCLRENDIYYIAFLKNFEKWKNLDNLMRICY